MLPPAEVSADKQNGFECVCPHGDNHKHSCEKRARIDGTASFVTGAFGLAAAGYVVRTIADPEKREPHQQDRQERRASARSACRTVVEKRLITRR